MSLCASIRTCLVKNVPILPQNVYYSQKLNAPHWGKREDFLVRYTRLLENVYREACRNAILARQRCRCRCKYVHSNRCFSLLPSISICRYSSAIIGIQFKYQLLLDQGLSENYFRPSPTYSVTFLKQ